MATATAVCGREILPVAPDPSLKLERESTMIFDLLQLLASPVFWGAGVPRGNGAAVIMVPGFLGSRIYPIYWFFDNWLFRTRHLPWPCGTLLNAVCPNSSTERLCEQIDQAVATTHMQVHLVGHSLGATLIRNAALRRPGKVATLTSISGTIRGARVHPLVYSLGKAIVPTPCQQGCSCQFHQLLGLQPPDDIARLAVWTSNDGVLNCQDSLEEAGGENVEIAQGTHVGLVVNPSVFQTVARFLAEHPAKEIA